MIQDRNVTPTKDDIVERISQLREFIHNTINSKNRPPTRKECVDHMLTRYDYSIQKYNRDIREINVDNTFLSDIARYNYSSYLSQIWENLESLEDETKSNFYDPSGFVKVNSKKIYLDIQKVKLELLGGKALDVSVELLGKRMRLLRDENTRLKLNSKNNISQTSNNGNTGDIPKNGNIGQITKDGNSPPIGDSE